MAIYNVGGLTLFNREKTIESAIEKSLSGDEIFWKNQSKFNGGLNLSHGIHLEGNGNRYKVPEHNLAFNANGAGTLVIENMNIVVDNLSNGLLISNWKGKIILRNSIIIYKNRVKKEKAYPIVLTSEYLSTLDMTIENCKLEGVSLECAILTIKNSNINGEKINNFISTNTLIFDDSNFLNLTIDTLKLNGETSYLTGNTRIKTKEGSINTLTIGDKEHNNKLSLQGTINITDCFIDEDLESLTMTESVVSFDEMIIPSIPCKAKNSSIMLENNVTDRGLWEQENSTISNRGFSVNTVNVRKSARDKLHELIGLGNVKDLLDEYIAIARVNKARSVNGVKNMDFSLHLALAGSPGTGKTTVANILAESLFEEGVIKEPKVIITSQEDLVDEVIGGTAKRTREKIDEALGGILFIDEAYSLDDKGEKGFGKEAISTLVNAMDKERDNLIVIIAGYTQPLKDLLKNTNPGFSSRFTNWVEFPDYSLRELWEISKLMLKEFELTEESKDLLQVKLFYFVKNNMVDGNARFVRNFIQKIISSQALRLSNERNYSLDSLQVITKEDIEDGFESYKNQLETRI